MQLLESVVELNSGLEEREEETYILTGQVKGIILGDSISVCYLLKKIFHKKISNFPQIQVEKATEELEEAERLEVEARREAVALQEQIEKMIQVCQYLGKLGGFGNF